MRQRFADYNQHRPKEIRINSGTVAAHMLVANKIEYARCLSFKEDQEIIQAILKRLKTGSIYWDIGASIGIYTVLTAKKVGARGAVHAFEPEQRSHQRLCENIQHNELTNVTVHNLALGRTTNTMTLSVTDVASAGTHSLMTGSLQTPHQVAEQQTVRVLPGDKLRTDTDLPVPNVVKVDVEGAEEDVLLGLRETLLHPDCHTVMCEVHFAILNSCGKAGAPKRIEKYLRECGFQRQKWLDRSHLIVYKELQND